MSLVEDGIDLAKREFGGALIGYLPLGFPTVEGSVQAAITLANSGCDVLELGLPYSDPVMDGLVIQRATTTALENGFRISDAFAALRDITSAVSTPTLVMTYWNPVLAYGVDKFASELKSAGGAGLITPDLIPDEASLWMKASTEYDLDRVFLAAPSSSESRVDQAISASRGFVYAVSTMGITGTRTDVDSAAVTLVKRLREQGAKHIGVGLGISTPSQVSEVLGYADGAIVGSALVQALAEGGLEALALKAIELATGKPGPA
jgi:tryptophan synthase alpha chain